MACIYILSKLLLINLYSKPFHLLCSKQECSANTELGWNLSKMWHAVFPTHNFLLLFKLRYLLFTVTVCNICYLTTVDVNQAG